MTLSNEEVNFLLTTSLACFQKGLYYDENELKEDALKMYEKGIELFEKAKESEDVQNNKIYVGLEPITNQARDRMVNLNVNLDKVNTKLKNAQESLKNPNVINGDLIYWLPDGVQLVMINKDDIFAPSVPCALAIFKLDDKDLNKEPFSKTSFQQPSALIQIGPWTYPLCLNSTAVLKNKLGVYVVPNPTQEAPEMCVGIILPREIDPRLEEEFVYVLNKYAVLKNSTIVENMTNEQKQRTSEKIAQYLIKNVFADFITLTALKTGDFISEQGEKYRTSFSKDSVTTSININPVIKYSAFILHKGSKQIGKMASFLVNKVDQIGESLGQKIINNVPPKTLNNRFVQGTLNIIGGGLTSASTIWMSLENASQSLFRNFAQETVETVQLKYGNEASETAHHALFAAGHTTLASFYLLNLDLVSIVKQMTKKAGLQVAKSHISNAK